MAEKTLTDLFRVLGQPARLQILRMIGDGEVCVCQMEVVLGKRQAYISQQMSVLREAGLVEAAKSGRNNFYRLTDPGLLDVVQAAADYLGVELPLIDVPDVSEVSSCGCSVPGER
ncbi:MAG: metalloregulator ArsR/SmtB family transcription factor [Anaerolineaceae bacterium]|nr:metalloregulator ArsR/SmtB family transcription factor [Anaerolineaceae bacterium]